MFISKLFLPLLKENPQEAQIISHRLMLRAGMIRQISSGIYSWLPLGLMVLRNIENIIREEMDMAGASEILMPIVQPASLWEESGRIEAYGKEKLLFKDRHDNNMIFGPTHEEVAADIFRNNVKSYKALPINLYQIQWKFRDEIRPRFGVMRSREFLMKDAYSFDLSEEEARNSYRIMFETYLKIFKRMGLQAIPMQAESGEIGGDLSHEFHIIADTGESTIFYDKRIENVELTLDNFKDFYAKTDDKHNEDQNIIEKEYLVQRKGIEVGHVFYIGEQKYSSMNLKIADKDGTIKPIYMGCYGIGVTRLVGAIIEAFHDDKGIIWPESVAPFQYSIIPIKKDQNLLEAATNIYQTLKEQGHSVLFDDSEASIGSKFATHDLIGVPKQIIIGPKNLAEGNIEVKSRKTGQSKIIPINSYKK